MALTVEQKKKVEELRNDPNIQFNEGMTDEEILEQARFIEDGEGIEVYDSEEAYREAMKNDTGVDKMLKEELE